MDTFDYETETYHYLEEEEVEEKEYYPEDEIEKL